MLMLSRRRDASLVAHATAPRPERLESWDGKYGRIHANYCKLNLMLYDVCLFCNLGIVFQKVNIDLFSGQTQGQNS